jgi:hypothetical protein
MGRNKGWRPARKDGITHLQCLDCGKFYTVMKETNADTHMVALDLIAHDNDCVPGKDKAPTGPIGSAFGMSIQLRDLFVMAQLSAKANVIVTEADAAFFYANADRLLAERDSDK